MVAVESLEAALKLLITSVLLGALAIAGAGCNKEDASSGTAKSSAAANPVATVNIETVFKTMGWGDEIDKIVKQSNTEILAEIEPRMKVLRDNVEAKKKDLAKAVGASVEAISGAKTRDDLEKLGLNNKQLEEYGLANAAAQQTAQQLNYTFQQQSMQRRQVVTAAYREALQTVIRRVATANNRSIVIAMPNQAILFSDATVDLTEKVQDDLQKNPPIKISVPDMPPIQWTPPPAPAGGPAPASQPGK
jgi:Skp family chaperone for outer membrane proteins